MKIVFAPDSFKGSASAHAVALALVDGWHSVRPSDTCTPVPMADGGEGTLEVLHATVAGSEFRNRVVSGPTREPVSARWLRLPDGAAVVELATASGFELVSGHPQPVTADTFGFGQLLADALESGTTRIFAAIGGSSSNDGGAGLLSALGGDLGEWKRIPGVGDPPLHIDLTALKKLPSNGVTIWSDVTNPLLGEHGTIATFGPQKGVTAELMPDLERRLARIAAAVEASSDQRRGLSLQPGSGAAGGAGFGLLAWGAHMAQGATAIADLVGLPAAIAEADLVVTGEGRLDHQTENGKVIFAVHTLAQELETPMAIVAGSICADQDKFARRGAQAVSLTSLAGSESAAKADAQRWLREAGAMMATNLESLRTGDARWSHADFRE